VKIGHKNIGERKEKTLRRGRKSLGKGSGRSKMKKKS
jgi:hypothetical protein